MKIRNVQVNWIQARLIVSVGILLCLASCEFTCKDGKITGFTTEDTTAYTCPSGGGLAGEELESCNAACPSDLSSERNRCLCNCACGTVCKPAD